MHDILSSNIDSQNCDPIFHFTLGMIEVCQFIQSRSWKFTRNAYRYQCRTGLYVHKAFSGRPNQHYRKSGVAGEIQVSQTSINSYDQNLLCFESVGSWVCSRNRSSFELGIEWPCSIPKQSMDRTRKLLFTILWLVSCVWFNYFSVLQKPSLGCNSDLCCEREIRLHSDTVIKSLF